MASFLKLHTDILSDPKLMRAARKGAKHLDLLPWILAFAKQAEDEGRLSIGGEPAEPVDIAQHIPCRTTADVAACLRELRSIGILDTDDDGVLRFRTWSNRNDPPSSAPSAVAKRVKAYRERQRQKREAAQPQEGRNDPVTPPCNEACNDPCNDPVTSGCNETEKEIEEEIEIEKEEEVTLRYAQNATVAANSFTISRWPEVEKLFPDVTLQSGVMSLLNRLSEPDADRLAAVIPMWFRGGRSSWVPTPLEVATGFAEYKGTGEARHVWAFISDVHEKRIPGKVGGTALEIIKRLDGQRSA